MMSANDIRRLHVFFVEVWLSNWVAYYREAHQNALTSSASMRDRRMKTESILFEREVCELAENTFLLMLNFLEQRLESFKEDLKKRSKIGTRANEEKFLLEQLTVFNLSTVSFSSPKISERQHTALNAQILMRDFAEDDFFPLFLPVFQRQMSVALANVDLWRDFMANMSSIVREVLIYLQSL